MLITLRALHGNDLDNLFRWESDPKAANIGADGLEHVYRLDQHLSRGSAQHASRCG